MRPNPIACDCCDKPLQQHDGATWPLAYAWKERQFGPVSFGWCWCCDCSDTLPAGADPRPAIVRRAERESPQWRDAVAAFVGYDLANA